MYICFLGYFMYTETLGATKTEYPILSTYGLYMSAVAIPLTFIVKRLLEKFGPSED